MPTLVGYVTDLILIVVFFAGHSTSLPTDRANNSKKRSFTCNFSSFSRLLSKR